MAEAASVAEHVPTTTVWDDGMSAPAMSNAGVCRPSDCVRLARIQIEAARATIPPSAAASQRWLLG